MKTTIRILMGVMLVVLILMAVGYFSAKNLHWEFLGEQTSPDGRFNTAIYNYQSDGDRHAPYGYYIYLQTNNLLNRKEGDLLFAGYCEITPEIEWVSDHQLVIHCNAKTPDDIRTLMSRVYGIEISLNQL